MNLDELRQTIEQHTGIPAALLIGETAEEVIARGKALLAFKRTDDPQHPKTPQAQFVEAFNNYMGVDPDEEASQALMQIETATKETLTGYPSLRDGGEVEHMPDGRSPKEQFAQWFGQQAAFDPFKQNGWKNVL